MNDKVKSANRQRSNGPIPVPEDKRCTHRTPSGTPCRVARRKGREFCIFHDQEFQEQRDLARKAKDRLDNQLIPDNAEGIQALLRRSVEEVRAGVISNSVANSIVYAAQMMMANLSNLERQRSAKNHTPIVDLEQAVYRTINDQLLDTQEKEILELGENSTPLAAAKNLATLLLEAKKRQVAEAAKEATASSSHAPAVETAS